MDELVFKLIKVLCPYLKDMAKRTKNPVDDIIVRIICSLADADDPVE